jgi:hypothetical protein
VSGACWTVWPSLDTLAFSARSARSVRSVRSVRSTRTQAQLLWRRTPRDVYGHESVGVRRADVGATVDGLFDTINIAVFDCFEEAELRRICACTPAPQAKRRRTPAILADSLRLLETRFATARERRPRARASCVRWKQDDHR